MKTLLGINGQTYLLPDAKDIAKVLEVLRGLTEVRSQTVYGPEGENRYSAAHGYCTKDVIVHNPAKIKIELVLDGDVVTEQEFERLTNLPETVG